MKRRQTLVDQLECAPDNAKLRGRIRNLFECAGIETLAQLTVVTRRELLLSKNVGPGIVGVIEASLEEMGLRLGMKSSRRVCPHCRQVIEE